MKDKNKFIVVKKTGQTVSISPDILETHTCCAGGSDACVTVSKLAKRKDDDADFAISTTMTESGIFGLTV